MAYQYYKKALKLRRKTLPANAIEFSTSYNTIGDLYFRQCMYDKALKYFIKDADLVEYHNPAHPDLISAKTNIGNIYSCLGRYNEALSYYMDALKLSFRLERGEHPFTGTIYNNIGFVYECAMVCDMQYRDMALDFYNKALDIRMQRLGELNGETAQTINNIGNVLIYSQDIDGAEENYLKALRLRKHVFGRYNSETMISYSSVATIFHLRQKIPNAIVNYKLAVRISRAIGLRTLDVTKIYQNLGDAYLAISRYDKAIKVFWELYVMLGELLEDDSNEFAITLSCMKYAFEQRYPSKDFNEWLSNQSKGGGRDER